MSPPHSAYTGTGHLGRERAHRIDESDPRRGHPHILGRQHLDPDPAICGQVARAQGLGQIVEGDAVGLQRHGQRIEAARQSGQPEVFEAQERRGTPAATVFAKPVERRGQAAGPRRDPVSGC